MRPETAVPALDLMQLSIALPAGADRRLAIESVDLQVARGEILCLVGESGSGKSVIAQAAMGLLPKALKPCGGQIRVDGHDLLNASPQWLRQARSVRMSMIFQEPMTALNPVLSCGHQIEEVLRRHTDWDAPRRRERVLAMLEKVRLPDAQRILRAYPHQLSGGQRQRVMIAMALILDPRLLIADEPTTALDVSTQAQILSLIRDLQREHDTAVLFITHDFGVVAELADRVAVLERGRLVESGSREAVLRRPIHAYTRMLIRSVPSMRPPAGRPPAADAPVLRVQALGKTYAGGGLLRRRAALRALAGVDLVVNRGETVGIVGESGSGKSTLARCVARLIDPTEGRIFLGEDEIGQLARRPMRAHRHRIQIVFQDPYRSLNPRRSVGDSIIEGPMYFGSSQTEAMARARSLMELVRLDPQSLSRYPHEFSGGQRQRICIARALAMQPELLIADEAVSALDVSVQRQVLLLLDDIRKRLQLAMLFITHDLRVAAQLCDRIGVMRAGELVEIGPTATLLSQPGHPDTQALIGAVPGRDWDFGSGIG